MQPSATIDALAMCIVHQVAPNTAANISLRDSVSSASDSLKLNFDCDRIVQLERELSAARDSIAEKEAKCMQLSELQNHVDNEVQELTEKLFQEAYRMVDEAETRRVKAEKLLAESRLKVDLLSAEVEALKAYIKSPSGQLFSQTSPAPSSRKSLTSRFLSSTPSRKERLNTSAGRKSFTLPSSGKDSLLTDRSEAAIFEIDPIYHREFVDWRENGATLDEDNSQFLSRILREDVHLCLNFCNLPLTKRVFEAIKANALELEKMQETKPSLKTCALSDIPRFCPYKMRVGDDDQWYHISLLARNRITAVCDFYAYIRYMNQGIVKKGINDSYWDIVELRKNMTLSRLGFSFSPKIGGLRVTCPQQ